VARCPRYPRPVELADDLVTEPEVADQEERRFIIIVEGVEVEMRESYDEPQ